MLADADPLLVVVAVAFAVINGANDGGALLSLSLRTAGLRLVAAWVGLSAAVALAPAVLGTGVATTLAVRLVDGGPGGQRMVAAAVTAAVVVIAGLGRGGLPTSLTVALVGGLVGAGLGGGGTVAWRPVGGVVAAALAAPLVGAVIAYGLSRLAHRLVAPGGAARFLARAHRLTFALQCVAYGANDGQKMLAVGAVATGLTGTGAGAGSTVPAAWPLLLGAAVAFLVGAGLGLRRYGRTVVGVIPLRQSNAVVAEASASAAVLGSAALGAPVSMTQAVAGGLVGTGVSEGQARVRWQVAGRIVVAWLVTLPAAVGVGAGLGALVAAVG